MRGLLATMRNAAAEARANRAALFSQMGIMALNDIVWVVFWILFFRRVGTIRGWDGERILLLLAVITSAGGISLGVLANARRIGAMAVDGELDGVLALPVPPLAHLLVRRVEAIHLGDLAFGVVLFAATGSPTLGRTAIFVGAVIAAATLITGFLVMAGSLAFFVGRNEGGELGFHAMVLLGSYPVDVFSGVAKVVLYSVVPAAFVSSVPARLIEDFDLAQAAWLATVAGFFALAGRTTFTRAAALHLGRGLDPTLIGDGRRPGRTARLVRLRRWLTIIVVMSETLPLAEIKAHLSEVVDRVERQHERVILTRNGRPAAVIMSPADLEALEDTLDLVSDPTAMKEIQAGRADVAGGRVTTGQELRAKYLNK